MSYAVAIMALALAAWAWGQALALRTLALAGARRACEEAGVQLLDESVSLARVSLRREPLGRRLVWWYEFEFSVDGTDRHGGNAELVAGRVESVRLAHPAGTTWITHDARRPGGGH